MTKLVERNTTIPTEKKQVFSTAADNQTGGDGQGLPGRARDGRPTTGCWASSTWRAFRRRRAACRRSRSSSTSTPTASSTSRPRTWAPARSRPSRSSSRQRPVEGRDRARCAATPRRTPPRTSRSASWPTLRNQADNMCYQLEKLMKEHADKLTDADKAPLEAAIEKTREAAKGDRRRRRSRRPSASWSGLARLQQGAVRERRAGRRRRGAGAARRPKPARSRRRRRDRRRVRSEKVTLTGSRAERPR